jgi:hypothetical protein
MWSKGAVAEHAQRRLLVALPFATLSQSLFHFGVSHLYL